MSKQIDEGTYKEINTSHINDIFSDLEKQFEDYKRRRKLGEYDVIFYNVILEQSSDVAELISYFEKLFKVFKIERGITEDNTIEESNE